MYHYYLFYDLKDEKTFHTPIEETEIQGYKEKYNIDVINISLIITEGHEINDLISNQFVKKVLELIDTNNFILEGF